MWLGLCSWVFLWVFTRQQSTWLDLSVGVHKTAVSVLVVYTVVLTIAVELNCAELLTMQQSM